MRREQARNREIVNRNAAAVAPFALGWCVGALVFPERSVYVHVFLGATLTATSVGITARVLKDLDRSQSAEARVILGAAVILAWAAGLALEIGRKTVGAHEERRG